MKADVEGVKGRMAEKSQQQQQQQQETKRTSQIYRELPPVEPKVAPDFERKLESAVVLQGTRHCFECVVRGSQPLGIEWLKNGMVLSNSARTSISYVEQTGACLLTIHEADVGDNALFACRVSGELGLAETSAYLKVKEQVKPRGSAPLVVTPLDSVQLNADSSYTLECIITGDPEPKVSWFKDNVDIESMPDPVRSTYKLGKFMNVRQLTITSTHPDWHSGAYTCRARNEYGEADCSCGILVRSKQLITSCFSACTNIVLFKIRRLFTNYQY